MGKFIVFEGIDGCGKGTQIRFLANWLRKKGKKVFLTKEPWRYGLRNIVRKYLIAKNPKWDDPEVDALIFAADRKLHLREEVIPALNKYDFVITDRYVYSSFAYQAAQGLDLKWLKEINRFYLKPDLTIILDVQANLAVKRIKERKVFAKYENVKFLEKVRNNFLKLSKKLNEKIIIVDSRRSKKEVFEDIKKIISKSFLS